MQPEFFHHLSTASPDVIMAVVLDEAGRSAAERIATRVIAIQQGREKTPNVEWPSF